MAEWQCLADSSRSLPALCGAQPTSTSALEGLAELLDDAAQAAELRAAVSAYQAKNPLYRELDYISRELEEYCFLRCIEAGGAAELGERLGRHLHFSYYGLLGYLMLLSPTLGSALCTALRFPLQLGSYFHIRLLHRAETGEAALQFGHFSGRPELFRFHVRLCAEAYRQIMATLGVVDGGSFRAQYRDEGGDFDGLCFDAALLELPLPYAQAGVFEQTLRQCCRLEQQIAGLWSQPLVQQVRGLLTADLRRFCAMPEAAAALHMTARTLHRRLRKEDTSFTALLDDVRLHAAVSLLNGGRTPAQIADELGFADTAAFKQAFKRWTGRTPSAWAAGQYR